VIVFPTKHEGPSNYREWAFSVKTVLRGHGLVSHLTADPPVDKSKVLVAEFSLLVVVEFLLSLREDDTRSWGNFLVYFSYKLTQMPCQPEGLGIHIYRLLASQVYAKMLV